MKLFENGTCQAADVMQGRISDCWLMQSIAAAAYRFPELVVESINPKVPSEQGVYSLRRHEAVRLSCLNAQGAGLWVMLMEKAFAKLGGGYSSLNNKKTSESSGSALCRILGGIPGMNLWNESPWEQLIKSESLWEQLVEGAQKGGPC
ncbi:hypothetical protein CYMTET_13170 [Cymbomonas tetramitiformis]|uniref:Calpain catalytic domain-containing protein n=1 Tax=Cymbomonas tetramitiformis TaxID=36881 RepID=A0AAE0GIZ0_9CHLO|nr:hypothetical protein CYMTET_13170 [Cymbomonas tetramitiformis]